jgi:hypothetical protein
MKNRIKSMMSHDIMGLDKKFRNTWIVLECGAGEG